MTYQDIPGWFNDEALYDRMVAAAPDPAIFVEVGCWVGKSTAYLAQKIQESGKAIRLVAVDTWEGSPDEPGLLAEVGRQGGSVFPTFLDNLMRLGLDGLVDPVMAESVLAASLVPDQKLDFVFIDADHRFEAVVADIRAWLPKVKVGGVLAGHDWCTYESVRRAVEQELSGRFTPEGNCWVARL